jgi:hypothetical protein
MLICLKHVSLNRTITHQLNATPHMKTIGNKPTNQTIRMQVPHNPRLHHNPPTEPQSTNKTIITNKPTHQHHESQFHISTVTSQPTPTSLLLFFFTNYSPHLTAQLAPKPLFKLTPNRRLRGKRRNILQNLIDMQLNCCI